MESDTAKKAAGAYFEYKPLEDVERLERYRSGGYHPVAIGDHLHGRYRIVHKLGFGGYSTIWLARDEEIGRYVAMKISTADSNSHECNILRHLGSVGMPNDKHPGKASIPQILDEFDIKGPNGEHRCIVTSPASTSLSDAREASYTRLFQLPVARAIIAQLIQAVAFLHSRGIVHADIYIGNILFRLPQTLDSILPEEIYSQYGQPHCEPALRLDKQALSKGVPEYGIRPVWLGKDSELIPLSEANIIITDFGESFLPSTTQRHYSNTPALSAPPEIRFSPEMPLSFPIDIWSLACAIWSIMGTRPPFEGLAPTPDWMTIEHVTLLGRLPPEWWEKWDVRLQWFNEDGTRNHEELGRPWAERFEKFVQEPRRKCGMEELGDEEKYALLGMLKAMLMFRPEERLTAAEVLESKWMKEWGFPELERMLQT
ncbi:hypothetical protein ASPWEDRAFT_51039 [Aspergillus wentii DTO 134E9]|uniref:non-specific serine/threonine protein kinase n=1 Tax=Aspergillus wentii DTO 134E9 TaxID=1073089 RepID=A0A1L9RIL5_ASPWE|nr:uncharacterized protein ASPWEDRAFT_51039 [Aspergillus wentii DTO 134E9]KAI9932288.1 hypothetical protein MW887_009800 [Aspergillus wentii]OJJ34751.1 hypothetical protein ASPWEDRAFT_51039 [Aspergillus wentii DTO 134E9]